jgi:hypothetical protein
LETYSSYESAGLTAGLIAFLAIFWIIALAIGILVLIAMWKVYRKAGYEGWEVLIPFYNMYVLLKIVGKPGWWLVMMLIPVVNLVFGIWTYNMLSKSFGKDEGFTVGMLLLGFIFIPILGFGSARYLGPYGDPEAYAAYQNRDKFDFDRS